MEGDKIKDLDKLLKDFYGNEVEIVDTKLTNLTAPGENYLSDVFKLDVTTRDKNGAVSIDHHVAKCVVTTSDIPPEMSYGVFKNEIIFYKEVIPAIQQFTKELGLQDKDFFPKLIAARLNLEDNDKPDENAVLIMENLVARGYKNFDRHKSFDLDAAKFLLSDLATFHAVPLAMKLLNFELFQKKIAENCKRPPPPIPKEDVDEIAENGKRPPPPFPKEHVDNIAENGKRPPPNFPGEPVDKDKMKPPNPIKVLRLIAKEDPFLRNHIPKLEKLNAHQEKEMMNKIHSQPDYTSPFLTLSHNDMWLNNTMQLTNDNDEIIKSKFVDFQMCSLEDPTLDLIFFIFSSVDLATLENHYDYLLMFYHECFIKTLEKCKCDVAPFAYDKFMKKTQTAIISTFSQIVMMTFLVIYNKKGEKTDFKVDELIPSDFHSIAINKFKFLFRKIIEDDLF